MFKIKVERVLNKSADQVFDALTDHANYKLFPGISDSRLLEKGEAEVNGKGALREVNAGPFTLIERIIGFDKPHEMKYKIETSSPIPMRHDKGEITIVQVANKARVLWVSEGHMNIPILGNVLDKAIEIQVSKIFNNMLSHIEKQ